MHGKRSENHLKSTSRSIFMINFIKTKYERIQSLDNINQQAIIKVWESFIFLSSFYRILIFIYIKINAMFTFPKYLNYHENLESYILEINKILLLSLSLILWILQPHKLFSFDFKIKKDMIQNNYKEFYNTGIYSSY